MPAKSSTTKKKKATPPAQMPTVHPSDTLLTCKQEVADVLGMSISTLDRYMARFPFAGKTNGRWRIFKSDVFSWWSWVIEEGRRHPEARRLRPAEPPALQEIQGR